MPELILRADTDTQTQIDRLKWLVGWTLSMHTFTEQAETGLGPFQNNCAVCFSLPLLSLSLSLSLSLCLSSLCFSLTARRALFRSFSLGLGLSSPLSPLWTHTHRKYRAFEKCGSERSMLLCYTHTHKHMHDANTHKFTYIHVGDLWVCVYV